MGATINLTGTMDNSPAANPLSGGTLPLDASTGPLLLDGGDHSTRAKSPPPAPTTWSPSTQGGTLDGVTLDGTLDMTQFPGSFSATQFTGSCHDRAEWVDAQWHHRAGRSVRHIQRRRPGFRQCRRQHRPDDQRHRARSSSARITPATSCCNASNEPLTFGPRHHGPGRPEQSHRVTCRGHCQPGHDH